VDVSDATGNDKEAQLRAIAQDISSEYAPRFKGHGADLTISGGNLDGLFPLTRTAFGGELDLSWLATHAFSPQKIYREIIGHSWSPLFRRVRTVRSTNEVDSEVRR
jgi:hypothetical protein